MQSGIGLFEKLSLKTFLETLKIQSNPATKHEMKFIYFKKMLICPQLTPHALQLFTSNICEKRLLLSSDLLIVLISSDAHWAFLIIT